MTLDDFAEDFPHFRRRAATGLGHRFFEHMRRAQAFVEMAAVTKVGLPAVSAVADEIWQMAGRDLRDPYKQLVGALARTQMRVNGFEKLGVKRSILHGAWNRGEVYRLAPADVAGN